MSDAQYEENTRALFDLYRHNHGMMYVDISIAWYDGMPGSRERRHKLDEWCAPIQDKVYCKIMMNRAAISSQVDYLLQAVGYDFNEMLRPNSVFMKHHIAEVFKDQFNSVKWPIEFGIICELVIDEQPAIIRNMIGSSKYLLRVYMMTLHTNKGIYIPHMYSQMPDSKLLPTLTYSMTKYLRGYHQSRM